MNIVAVDSIALLSLNEVLTPLLCGIEVSKIVAQGPAQCDNTSSRSGRDVIANKPMKFSCEG